MMKTSSYRGGLAFACLLAALASLGAEEAPSYELSADAAASLSLASAGLDPTVASTAAIWSLSANLLHRFTGSGWGLVLSHNLDLSGQSLGSTVYEAYARLDLADWGQLFVGMRRMGLGLGTTFAPGDLIDPRDGFWDQKSGFRGIGLSASLGSELALRAALSLDRNFNAYLAGLRAKAATALAADYAKALDGSAGPADPRLMVGALSADAQFGALEASLAGVYGYNYVERPSLGLSYDLGGLILQAEGAVELSGGLGNPLWYGTAGARSTWSDDSLSVTLSLDYNYNGEAGLLRHTHYLLPWVNVALADVYSLTLRSLLEVEAPSALVSASLILYPAPGFDFEFTGLFSLGDAGGEFATLPSLPSPGPSKLTTMMGLAARVHF